MVVCSCLLIVDVRCCCLLFVVCCFVCCCVLLIAAAVRFLLYVVVVCVLSSMFDVFVVCYGLLIIVDLLFVCVLFVVWS